MHSWNPSWMFTKVHYVHYVHYDYSYILGGVITLSLTLYVITFSGGGAGIGACTSDGSLDGAVPVMCQTSALTCNEAGGGSLMGISSSTVALKGTLSLELFRWMLFLFSVVQCSVVTAYDLGATALTTWAGFQLFVCSFHSLTLSPLCSTDSSLVPLS